MLEMYHRCHTLLEKHCCLLSSDHQRYLQSLQLFLLSNKGICRGKVWDTRVDVCQLLLWVCWICRKAGDADFFRNRCSLKLYLGSTVTHVYIGGSWAAAWRCTATGFNNFSADAPAVTVTPFKPSMTSNNLCLPELHRTVTSILWCCKEPGIHIYPFNIHFMGSWVTIFSLVMYSIEK